MVFDVEIIDHVTRYRSKFEVDMDTVSEDVISEVEHGGQYLVQGHTFDFNIAKRMDQLLGSYEKSQIAADVFERMVTLVRECGVEEGLIEKLTSND